MWIVVGAPWVQKIYDPQPDTKHFCVFVLVIFIFLPNKHTHKHKPDRQNAIAAPPGRMGVRGMRHHKPRKGAAPLIRSSIMPHTTI